jgi:Zn-dependent protease with chaperone function
VVVLALVELVKIPPEWLAPVLPDAIQQRLVDQDLRAYYGSYCTSPEGERALRDLMAKFDKGIARSVKIQVTNRGEFLVTAVPRYRLAITYAFLQALEPDELAALLAHEIAHLQRREEVRAALRANGTLGALIGTLSGTRTPDYNLEFSQEEEMSADLRAIQMLRSARISTLPAAGLFDRMETERMANRSFGKEQYYLHGGLGSARAAHWRDAQDQSERLQAQPALRQDQADALFNYCWRHRGPPRHPLPPDRTPETQLVRLP